MTSGRLLGVRVNDNLKDADDAELRFGLSKTQQPGRGRADGSLLVRRADESRAV
jgi:hypothetical protein